MLHCGQIPSMCPKMLGVGTGAEAHGTADLRPETMDLSVHAPNLDVQGRLYMQAPDLEAMKKATTQAEVTALAHQVNARFHVHSCRGRRKRFLLLPGASFPWHWLLLIMQECPLLHACMRVASEPGHLADGCQLVCCKANGTHALAG